MSKSPTRIKYEASAAGKATIERCQIEYRDKIKRVTVVLNEDNLYLYQALLKLSFDQEKSISSVVVSAIREYLLTQQPTIEYDKPLPKFD
jgi:hypothetical protein